MQRWRGIGRDARALRGDGNLCGECGKGHAALDQRRIGSNDDAPVPRVADGLVRDGRRGGQGEDIHVFSVRIRPLRTGSLVASTGHSAELLRRGHRRAVRSRRP